MIAYRLLFFPSVAHQLVLFIVSSVNIFALAFGTFAFLCENVSLNPCFGGVKTTVYISRFDSAWNNI
jgi:hypothetical protein